MLTVLACFFVEQELEMFSTRKHVRAVLPGYHASIHSDNTWRSLAANALRPKQCCSRALRRQNASTFRAAVRPFRGWCRASVGAPNVHL